MKAEPGDIDPPRVLLSGWCRLGFESQFFVPDGELTRQCWLEVSETARGPLWEMLGADWNPTFDDFHAEFWGTISWSTGWHEHFGLCDGRADMDKLISARIIPPPPSPPRKKYNSILEALQAGRAAKR